MAYKKQPLLDLTEPNSLHVHSLFSDGRAEPEVYVQRALELGLAALGFSEHGSVPFASEWNMPAGRLPAYLAEIARLKKKYAGRIEILAGIEADWLAGTHFVQGPAAFSDHGIDYTIGGVHYLEVAGKFLEIDHTPQILQTIVDRGFSGSVPDMVAAYYGQVRDMLRSQPPTILAHIDLVKKFNREMRLFDEGADWYRSEALATLEVLAQTDVLLEVNTAPLYRGFDDQPYPSAFILQRARELEIPVIVTSDAHAPEFLTAAYAGAIAMMRFCGYPLSQHENVLKKRLRRPV